jgi:hypothetical protein
MNKVALMKELKRLQNKSDAIRAELGINPPGAILFQVHTDNLLVVVADGFGGATTSVVEGNYPVDYSTKYERIFASEQEAESAAEAVATGKASASAILGILA